MRVFVTGGTGHAGSYIVPELIAAGHEVTGVIRKAEQAEDVRKTGAEAVVADVEKLSTDEIAETLAGHDVVVWDLARADIAELWEMRDDRYAVMCVQHDHAPEEKIKFKGNVQTKYDKKNWSSLMLMNCAKCTSLTPPSDTPLRGAAF